MIGIRWKWYVLNVGVVLCFNVFGFSKAKRGCICNTVWLSPFGTQTSWLLLLDIITPEFSGTLDFLNPFQKNSRNSRLHTNPRTHRTFSSDFAFSTIQHTSNRMVVNSYLLDLLLDPWTHKHIQTPAGVTFVTRGKSANNLVLGL